MVNRNTERLYDQIGKILTTVIIVNFLKYSFDNEEFFKMKNLRDTIYLVIGLIIYYLFVTNLINNFVN